MSGTLNFGRNGTTVNFTVTSSVIIGPAAGALIADIEPDLDIGTVASAASINVTRIGVSAFTNCTALVSIVIPNTVIEIRNSAFQGCTGFRGTLTIPASVFFIGNSAFLGCSGFTGPLTIPNTVRTIGMNAFQYCSGFTSLTLSTNSLFTTIEMNTFDGCSGFTGTLTIPSYVKFIGAGAFNGCSGFTGSLTIPNTVRTIGDLGFQNCSGFTSLTLPTNQYYVVIDDYVFSGCSGFTGTLTIPNNVLGIGPNAFSGCSGFTSLILPNNITSIYVNAFSGCSGFTGTLTIPSSVTSIGVSSFSGCSGFKNITIPSSVTSISSNAFSGISAPTEITFSCNNPPFSGIFTAGQGLRLFYTSGTLTGWNTAINGYTALLVGPPGAPTSPIVTYSGNTGTLTFTAPTNRGGYPITFYEVYLASDLDTKVFDNGGGATTSVTMAGLANGSTDYVLVAMNQAGDSTGTAFQTVVSGGGGGAGDPYVTTFSNISYKLPTMDAPIRYFQTMDGGKLLTINVQLKTVENAELADDTLRSLIVLRKKMTTKQYAAMVAKVMKPETLCFFERVSIQYGEQRLVVNLWDSKFELVENTLRCGVEKVDRADLLKKSGGIYNGYTTDTVKLTLGRTAVFLSTYDSPLIRNGIYVESAALKGANGVVVNALSLEAMKLSSLSCTEPVATKDSLKAVTKVETFVDHEGLRSRNIVTYK